MRVPYLQLREATILAQSLYRGLVVRRLVPQLKKEKQQRDVSKTVNTMKYKLTLVWPAGPTPPLLFNVLTVNLSILNRRGGVGLAGQTKTYAYVPMYSNKGRNRLVGRKKEHSQH